MQITLQLFGAFRPYGDKLTLTLEGQAVTADLRPALKAVLSDADEMVDQTRFATDTAILSEDAPLQDGMVLAALPPVSGG